MPIGCDVNLGTAGRKSRSSCLSKVVRTLLQAGKRRSAVDTRRSLPPFELSGVSADNDASILGARRRIAGEFCRNRMYPENLVLQ